MSGLGNCGWETPYGGRRAENGRANETATDSYGAKSWPEEPYALIGLVRDCGGASRSRLALPGSRIRVELTAPASQAVLLGFFRTNSTALGFCNS